MIEEKDKKPESLYLKLIPYFDKYGILLLLLIISIVKFIFSVNIEPIKYNMYIRFRFI